MNLFFLSQVAAECARFHCDKHVVKMILEYAQLMYSAHSVNNANESWRGAAPFGGYKKTHAQHPTAIWARSCQGNYALLAEIAKELCREYTHRYSKQHKTEQHIDWLREHLPPFPPPLGHDGWLPSGQLTKLVAVRKPVYFSSGPAVSGCTPLPLAMPDDCYLPDACLAYQKLYLLHKRSFAKWTKRDIPAWFSEGTAKLPPLPPPEKKPQRKQPAKKQSKKRRPLNDGEGEVGEHSPSGKRKKLSPVKPESPVAARKQKSSRTPRRTPSQQAIRDGAKVLADVKSTITRKNRTPPAVRVTHGASVTTLRAKCLAEEEEKPVVQGRVCAGKTSTPSGTAMATRARSKSVAGNEG